jgi:hypothetical protein
MSTRDPGGQVFPRGPFVHEKGNGEIFFFCEITPYAPFVVYHPFPLFRFPQDNVIPSFDGFKRIPFFETKLFYSQ